METAQPEINQGALLEQIGTIFEEAASNPEMPRQIYDLFSLISTILFEYKTALESGQEMGWADNIRKEDGSPAFEPHEAKALETSMAPFATHVKALFAPPLEVASQHGGAFSAANALSAATGNPFALGSLAKQGIDYARSPEAKEKLRAAKQYATDKALQVKQRVQEKQDAVAKKMIESLKGQENMSLDYAVEKVAAYLDALNEKSRSIAETIGILKLEKTVPIIPIPTPFAGIPLQVPTRLIVLVFQGIIEFIRITFSFSNTWAATLVRIFGSFGAALIDAGKGDWKSAVFSILGIFNGNMAIMGAVGKMIVKVFSFVSDDVSSTLGWAMYDSAKSWVAGIWIFVFSVFAPAVIRDHVNGQIGGLNKVLAQIDGEIQSSVSKIQGEDAFSCYTVTPNHTFKSVDFSSLDRLQALLGNPAFHCSPNIVTMINGLSTNPVARIILELIGLPTTTKGLERSCKGMLGKTPDMSVLLEDVSFDVQKKDGEECQTVEASADDLIAALKKSLTGKPAMLP
jgi:hypothetical protein